MKIEKRHKPKPESIPVLFTEKFLVSLDQVCSDNGLSMSDYYRRAVLELLSKYQDSFSEHKNKKSQDKRLVQVRLVPQILEKIDSAVENLRGAGHSVNRSSFIRRATVNLMIRDASDIKI